TRAIHCHAWQGFHAGDDVYLSREVPKWICELVGTIWLDQYHDQSALHDEIICLVFQAIIGTSRLPLTSVESPLPSYSLGQIGYFHRPEAVGRRPASAPMHTSEEIIERALGQHLNNLERAKLLETVLRTVTAEEIQRTAQSLVSQWLRLGW